MRRPASLFNHIRDACGRIFCRKRPKLPPESMSEAAKEAAFAEARRLHSLYAVEVKALSKGEKPGLPKQVELKEP